MLRLNLALKKYIAKLSAKHLSANSNLTQIYFANLLYSSSKKDVSIFLSENSDGIF